MKVGPQKWVVLGPIGLFQNDRRVFILCLYFYSLHNPKKKNCYFCLQFCTTIKLQLYFYNYLQIMIWFRNSIQFNLCSWLFWMSKVWSAMWGKKNTKLRRISFEYWDASPINQLYIIDSSLLSFWWSLQYYPSII